ncbi:Nascent polypeptide-associated complex subunit alpha, muscle-specific form [Ceratobasidium sp. AG-Ba]|nr:Nascent polypeptide-associated complex subunit alpha, muscle-specific form [Ceratobasidium sp. AG-Ba]
MPPFSMLRTKKGAKSSARPRTPPSPGSFYSPVRSPAPWLPQPHPSRSSIVQTWSREPQLSASVPSSSTTSSTAPAKPHPPSAWAFDARQARETPGLQLDLGPAFESEDVRQSMHSRRPSEPPTPPPKGPLAAQVARPSASAVVLPAVAAVAESQRRVPTPIKIPRMHVHAPSVTIERTPATQSQSSTPAARSQSPPPSSNPTPSTGSSVLPSPDASASIISESAPELVTILRAERASATVYGLGFGLTLRPTDAAQMTGLARQDSATLPREGPYTMPGLSPMPPNGLSPVPGSSSTGPSDAPSPPSSKGKSPLRRSMSTDEGLARATYSQYVPAEDMAGIVEVPTSPFPASPSRPDEPTSPMRVRSKTLTERRDRDQDQAGSSHMSRQRSATVDLAPHIGVVSGSHAAPGSSSNIRRARSPSGATTLTHPSRPVTPPDSFPPELVGLVGMMGRKGSGAGMTTQAQVAGLALQTGTLGLSYLDPPSPSDSPRVRTMRLQSAPNPAPTPAPAPASMLSKFARSQFEGFSFSRGRSVSETSAAALPIQQRERGWTVGAPPLSPIAGEVEVSPPAGVPVRPARPPSLTLKLDEPAPVVTVEDPKPALRRGNSGSSAGSGLARVGSRRLRRKRSSPRQGGTKVLPPDGLERKASLAGSHGRSSSSGTGTQQPTPTSSNSSPLPSGLALKQRRETVFPTTPRSFSNESFGEHTTARSGDFPGFVLDGSLLMPLKSPAVVSSGRKAHLPIGPRVNAPTPAPAPTAAPAASVPVSVPGPSVKPSRSKQPASPRPQPKQPPSPAFEPIPVRWRGLTMDAAKWTFSSDQLQSIVSRAIRQSAETSSVRLLSLDVLDQELPTEVERLEQLRDVLQTKYKAQVRRRRLLMRSLALYIDGHDPPTSRRLMDELEDVGNVCDQLAEDLYLVGDQLSQISKLRDVHSTSALAVALRKINGSYIRARSEVVELQAEKDALEAERDQAWMLAESLERELAEARQGQGETSSRVSAARKSSVRQSKLSLRPSVRRSARSSTSGGSMRYHGIVFPRPPSTHGQVPTVVADSANTSGEFIPPVPPVPTPSKHLSTFEPSRPESIGVLPSGAYAQLSPVAAAGPNEQYSVLSVPTPSATSHELYTAQSELLKMLGLSYTEYGFRIRPRSYSDSGSPVSSPPGSPSLPPSAYGPRGKLLRSTSDQALRRYSTSTSDRMIAVRVPATGGVLEDPAAILAALTLPQD